MAMTDKRIMAEMEDAGLDALFAEARRDVAAPSDALLARILADAAAEMPRAAPVTSAPSAAPGGGWFATLLGGIGGWGGIGGLATATLAGVWIGFSGQVGGTTVTDYLASATGSTGTVELFPSADDFLTAAGSEG